MGAKGTLRAHPLCVHSCQSTERKLVTSSRYSVRCYLPASVCVSECVSMCTMLGIEPRAFTYARHIPYRQVNTSVYPTSLFSTPLLNVSSWRGNLPQPCPPRVRLQQAERLSVDLGLRCQGTSYRHSQST